MYLYKEIGGSFTHSSIHLFTTYVMRTLGNTTDALPRCLHILWFCVLTEPQLLSASLLATHSFSILESFDHNY